MPLFDRLRAAVSRPVTGAIAEPVNAVAGLVSTIGNQIRGGEPVDPNLIAELEAKSIEAQAKVNEEEAKHASIFVAGWRPFVGWVIGTGLAMEFVVRQVMIWIAFFRGIDKVPPSVDLATLIPLLLAMLGVAGYRTYEKVTDSSGNH